VPNTLFVAIALACTIVAAIPCVIIWSKIAARPTAEISAAKLAEFAQKREALRTADELFRDGNYKASVSAYETYHALYPYSTVARDGAVRARAALEGAKRDAGATRSKQSQKRNPTVMQDIRRSVKRLFRGK
jgi:hypothetical protein